VPKQLHKINAFHGGLNSNSDPRDILDNELAIAENVSVDELGKIINLGGTATAISQKGLGAGTIAGHGLFAFKSDFSGAEGGTTDESATNYLAMMDADADAQLLIYKDDGSYTGSWSKFRIYDADVNSGSAIVDHDAANSGIVAGLPVTGTGILADTTVLSITSSTRFVLSQNADTSTDPVTLTFGYDTVDMVGGQGNIESDMYYVDGNLRVSDGNFANTNNLNKWYGYIKRTIFPGADTFTISEDWYDVQQKIEKPVASALTLTVAGSIPTIVLRHTTAALTTTTNYKVVDDSVGHNIEAGDGNVAQIVISWEAVSTSTERSYNGEVDITCGKTNDGTNFTGVTKSSTVEFNSTNSYDTDSGDITITSNHSNPDWAMNGTASPSTEAIMVEIGDKEEYGTGVFKMVLIKYYSASGSPTSHSLAVHDSALEVVFASEDNSVGWGSTVDYKWDCGLSFIYDYDIDSPLAQESLIRQYDAAADAAAGDGESPEIKLSIKYGTNGVSNWNKRITGAKLYMRKREGDTYSSWHPQIKFNFLTGMSKVYLTGYEQVVSSSGEVNEHYWHIAKEKLLQPNLADTYKSETGVNWDENSVTSKWKTSTVIGRQIYIGGVQMKFEDGSPVKNFSDTMLKSIPGKFDIFPEGNKVDVATNDGDDIVKLESFADRILQFKRKHLYIINVSQQFEFLEATHAFKGVMSPCSVTKTDYGIAWANEHGCYLYDGTTVHNLFEKQGRKIISDDEWDKFLRTDKALTDFSDATCILTNSDATVTHVANALITDGLFVRGNPNLPSGAYIGSITDGTHFELNTGVTISPSPQTVTLKFSSARLVPMVGYLPKKRQLIVFDDKGNGNGTNIDPRLYIYDLVTKAWVTGTENQSTRLVMTTKTNFANDWDGNLIYGYTVGVSPFETNIIKWDETPDTTPVRIQTKDIDFGHPGQRKNISKVHITYKSGAAVPTVTYGVDGGALTNAVSSGSFATGQTSWARAEFKFGATTKNIYSFQLKISGTATTGFEINDISIVYRPKNVK